MDKPEKILLSYVHVRGPALAATHNVIKNNENCSFNYLKERFCMPKKNSSKFQTEQLDGCLKFLRTVDIVEMNSVSGKETYRIVEDLSGMPFHVLLLRKLRLAEDGPSRPHSFYEVQKVLVQNDISFIHLDQLRRLVEKSLRARADLDFTWTLEKLNFWMELADFLGLGTKTTSRSFIFYPSPQLVHTLLESFSQDSEQKRLSRFVEYLRSNFFECLTQHGDFSIFKGLQQTLLLLEGEKRIRLISMSDDPELVKVGNNDVSLISIEGG